MTINKNLLDKTFSMNDDEYVIKEKYSHCQKNITELIIAKENKHISSLFRITEINKKYEIYGFDIMVSKKSKKYCLLVFNNETHRIRGNDIGYFPNSKSFIETMKNKAIEIEESKKYE